DQEIIETMRDLHDNGCQLLTIGQYLQPTKQQLPVDRYVTPELFDSYKKEGEKIGFDNIESAPLVRSSYMAEKSLVKLRNCK
ncbi:MAG: lipoyl synthase, partial [Rikenellaceae bacterium]